MFNRFTSRTPHGNALNHLRNMFGYFLVSALLVFYLEAGVQAIGFWSGLLGGIFTAGVALIGGIFATMTLRNTFGLVQTGRALQYGSFWLTTWLALFVVSAVSDGAIALTAAPVAAFLICVLAFGGATTFGEVPKRTWLPIKKK